MKTLVLVYGRFQGPHKGHYLMCDTAWDITKSYCTPDDPTKAEMIIVPTKTYNIHNPIPFQEKVQIMNIVLEDFAAFIKPDAPSSIIDILKGFQDNYQRVVLVCGADRAPAFERIMQTYNGIQYEYEDIQVVSCGPRDGSTDVSTASGTKVRESIAARDYDAFDELMPSNMTDESVQRAYDLLSECISEKEHE